MKYTFKTFPCGAGDCIFLVIENGEQTISIMVDCGQYSSEIDDFVKNELGNEIDYLIVTHIDNDHINGLVTMLRQNKEISIKHILLLLSAKTQRLINHLSAMPTNMYCGFFF